MTRHALRQHAPDGAIFAVSSYGPGSTGNRPPAELHPLGLEGPLGWLAEQLEARDRARWSGSGTSPPTTCPGSSGASPPTSNATPARTGRTSSGHGSSRLVRQRKRRRAGEARRGRRGGVLALVAGYDFWGFQSASAFERDPENPAPAVARRWSGLLAWHPSLPFFWPVAGPGGRPEEGRVDRQGGRRPGRDRDRRARPRRTGSRRSRTRPPSSPRPSARSSRRTSWSATTSAGRKSTPRPSRSRPSTTPRSRWPSSTRSSASSPTRPAAPRSSPWRATSRREVAARRSAVERKLVDDLVRSGIAAGRLARRPDRPGPPVPGRPPREHLPHARSSSGSTTTSAGSTSATSSGPATTPGATRPTSPPGSSGTRTTSRPTRRAAGTSARRSRPGTGSSASGTPTPTARPTTTPSPTPTTSPRSPAGSATTSATTPTAASPRTPGLPRLVGQGLGPRRLPRHAPPGRGRPVRRQVPLAAAPPTSASSLEVGRRDPRPVAGDPQHPPADLGLHLPPPDPLEARRPGHRSGSSTTTGPPREVYTLNSRQGDPLAMRLLSGTIKPAKGGSTTLVFSSDFAVPTLGKPE